MSILGGEKVKKYRKIPVVIEAMQYLREENISSLQDWFVRNNSGRKLIYYPDDNEYYIETLEGNHRLSKGDYVIKGIKGEFYPCKPDIFEQTYELVEQ
jgi:hypothetical protein